MRNIKKHVFEYLLLATVGVFFLFLLTLFGGDRVRQFVFMAFFTGFYILWGIIHHKVNKTLHFKIVLEYILIGALGLFLLEILLIL